MNIVLYHMNNSVCCDKVRITLREKGLSWKIREVDFWNRAHLKPDYLRLNPKGVVPTLVVDDQPLVESTLIVEFLDDRFPEPALKPVDPIERTFLRLFPKMCDEGLHQGVAVLSFAAVFMDDLRATPGGAMVAINKIVDLERRDRQTAVYEHGVEAPHVFRGVAAFEKAFQKIDLTLADGREWLSTSGFSIAEINLAPYLARLEVLGLLPIWTQDRLAVIAWFERLKARPSFQSEVEPPENWRAMLDGGMRIKSRVAELRKSYLANDPGAAYF